MSEAERDVLLRYLGQQRAHVAECIEGLDADALRRSVLPSGWSCLGLVNHLSLDVERFWFQAVVAGERAAIDDVMSSSANAWIVAADDDPNEVLERYRRNIERADEIMASSSLDAAPAWWPADLFGTWRLETTREVVLHVIAETAAHAGHLDAARELIDGKLYLVLT